VGGEQVSEEKKILAVQRKNKSALTAKKSRQFGGKKIPVEGKKKLARKVLGGGGGAMVVGKGGTFDRRIPLKAKKKGKKFPPGKRRERKFT